MARSFDVEHEHQAYGDHRCHCDPVVAEMPALDACGRIRLGASREVMGEAEEVPRMSWLSDTLVAHPEIAIFLALAAGFYVGRFSYRGIGLGAVTATLLAGVVIGALAQDIKIDNTVKQVFFLLFLFALGYKLGPQFFAGLKGSGAPQALFTLAVVVVALATVLGVSAVLGYNPGLAAGLAAGGLTQSSIIGVGQDAIRSLSEDAATVQQWSDLVPVGYAVTYILGTVGAAIYCATIAPRLLGITDLPRASRELEERLGFHDVNPDVESAYLDVVRRCYVVEGDDLTGRTVHDLEVDHAQRNDARIYIARIRRGGTVEDAAADTVVRPGDTIVVTDRRSDLLEAGLDTSLREVDDHELLDFPIEDLTIVATSAEVVGRTVGDLREHPLSRRLFLKSISRGGTVIPHGATTRIDAGDELRVQGPLPLVEQAVPHVGFPERTTPTTDMVTVGLGVAIGALVGIPTVTIAGVPIGLTTIVGALLLGLLLGWRRSKSPTFGNVPPGAQWFFETVGLTVFVAVVGINSGPGFVSGLQRYGLGLFFAGLVVTLTPLVAGTLLARYVFKFDPVLTLGILAGAQTTTAAVGAVQESARSRVPLLGFTVPYAVGNVLLTIGGAVVVALRA